MAGLEAFYILNSASPYYFHLVTGNRKEYSKNASRFTVRRYC